MMSNAAPQPATPPPTPPHPARRPAPGASDDTVSLPTAPAVEGYPDGVTELVPLTGAAAGFDLALRGYDRRQVDLTVGRLEDRLGQLESVLDASERQISALADDNSRLRADLQAAHERLARGGAPTRAELGERMATMLRLAEEEAAALRSQAQAQAATVRADAEAAADALRRETAAELASQRAAMEKVTAKLAADQEREKARHAKEIEAARAAAQAHKEKGAREVDAMRNEAQAELVRLRQEAATHHDWVLSQAKEQAEQMRGEARREVAEKTRQRDDIHADLTRLRELLATATGGSAGAPTGQPDRQPQTA